MFVCLVIHFPTQFGNTLRLLQRFFYQQSAQNAPPLARMQIFGQKNTNLQFSLLIPSQLVRNEGTCPLQ